MTILRRIETLANDVAKDYSNVRLLARGTPTFLDPNLRGSLRFARSAGNFLPVLAPNNSTSLGADTSASTADTQLVAITPLPEAFTTLGAVLTIGPGRELVQIADIDTTTGAITTVDPIIGTHTAGTQVDLFGVPVEVIGPWAKNATTIQVRSEVIVIAGDQIAIATTPTLINSTVSTLITSVTFLGTALDGRNNYELTLDQPITRSLVNEEDILLRGQAGYESQELRLSTVRGPFLVDYVSGPFFGDTIIDEYLNVRLKTALGDPVPGFADFVPVTKNAPIVNVRVPAESILFWQPIKGSVQLRGTTVTAITDAQGEFAVFSELVPAWPPGNEWVFPILSNTAALLRVRFTPNEFRDASLFAGVPARVTVGIGSGEQPGTRVEIVIKGAPGAQVEIGDWLPSTSAVATLAYQVTSTAYGPNTWQASSLTLKPYFFTLADISARYDAHAYDQGVVHF